MKHTWCVEIMLRDNPTTYVRDIDDFSDMGNAAVVDTLFALGAEMDDGASIQFVQDRHLEEGA